MNPFEKYNGESIEIKSYDEWIRLEMHDAPPMKIDKIFGHAMCPTFSPGYGRTDVYLMRAIVARKLVKSDAKIVVIDKK